MLHRDLDVTAKLLDEEHPGDGDAWRALHDQWRRLGPSLVDALVRHSRGWDRRYGP